MFVDKIGEEESGSCQPEIERDPLVPEVVDSEMNIGLILRDFTDY